MREAKDHIVWWPLARVRLGDSGSSQRLWSADGRHARRSADGDAINDPRIEARGVDGKQLPRDVDERGR